MMSIHRAHWITLLVLGVWLAVTPMALAGGGQENFTIRATLDKTFVSPGDIISVTGSGAEAGVLVNVQIVPDPASGANALTVVEVMPDANGNFSTSVTVPDTATTGRYAVRAEQPPGNGALVTQYYWVGICVNECTGETLGSMLPETGGISSTGALVSLSLSGLLVGTLTVQGIRRARVL
ncbi:MAG: autotransporter outer membrane beta-barrel domain-containing protein [Anaerolineae bacterium]|jgi:hypothetical protein